MSLVDSVSTHRSLRSLAPGAVLLAHALLLAGAAHAEDRANVWLENWGGLSLDRDALDDDLERLVAAGLTARARCDEQRSEPRPEERLLIEWPRGEGAPTKPWLSTLPAMTPVADGALCPAYARALLQRLPRRWCGRAPETG